MKKLNTTKLLFGSYVFLLIWIILFKASFSFSDVKWLFGSRSINLIPFYYDRAVSFQLEEVMMNVLIFVPFALYLKMLDVNSKKCILYGFLSSMVFESCQFLFGMGASDITDIITNTGGTILGVIAYIVLEKCFHNKAKINKVLTILAFIATILIILLGFLLFIANYG